MNRFSGYSLTCVDARIYSAFFTLICINQVFSFVVDSRVVLVGVAKKMCEVIDVAELGVNGH